MMSSQSMAVQLQMPKPPLQYHQRDFLMIRQETKAFCDDLIEAVVFRVIEAAIESAQHRWYQMAKRTVEQGKPAPKMPKTWWITLSYSQIKEAIYEYVDDVKTVMARVLDLLLKKKVVLRRPDPANPRGAPQYTINGKSAQKKIDAQQKERPPKNGYRTTPVQEPVEGDSKRHYEEDNAHLSENRSPKNGYRINPDQEAHEEDSEQYKNEVGLQKTDTEASKKRYGRSPKNGYTEDKEKITLKEKKKDSAQARLALLSAFPLLRSRIDFGSLRRAPFSEETILALTSSRLPVPDYEAIKAEASQEALTAYEYEWRQGAKLLYAATCTLEPARAWERINQVIAYMTDPTSPSWWVQGRTTPSQVTLRNVENNFIRMHKDLTKRQWYPDRLVPYDGPPLELVDYEVGYGGSVPITVVEASPVDDAIEVVAGEIFEGPRVTRKLEPDQAVIEEMGIEEGPRTDEVPAVTMPPQSAPIIEANAPLKSRPVQLGMEAADVQDLVGLITAQYPSIQGKVVQLRDDSYAIGIDESEISGFLIRRFNDWLYPPPKLVRRIERAIAFGESLTSAPSQEADVGMEANEQRDVGQEDEAVDVIA